MFLLNEFKWKGKCCQYIAALTGTFSIISFGANSGWSSPYLPYLLSNSSTIPTTSEEGSWCAVAPLIGCAFGAILAANLADRIGRKYSILIMAPIVFLSFIGIGFATSIWYLCALRFIVGIADGALYTVLPMYIGEIVDPSIRGFLSSTLFIFYILGTLLINIIGSAFDIFTSSMICAAIPAIHFSTFIFMPESPYYYIKVKKFEQAEKSLKQLKASNNVSKNMEVLQEAIRSQEDMKNKPKITDLFTIPSNRKASYIVLILTLTNKMSGKMPIMFYTTIIFQESGSTIDPTLSVIVYCLVELIFVTLTTFFIIDRFGKKFLITISTAGCGLSLFLLATYFYLKDFHSGLIQHLNWLPITVLVSYNILFSIGIGYSGISYLSELFPTNVKANALCVGEIVTIIFSTISSKFFQLLYDHLSTMSIPFFSFSACCWIGLVFIIKYVPETKGKTLEEIQDFLNKKKTRTGSIGASEN